MKKMNQSFCTALVALGLFVTVGCSNSPNDDGNSTDTKNSNGEGAVDSTRLPNIRTDNSQMPDTAVHGDTSTAH